MKAMQAKGTAMKGMEAMNRMKPTKCMTPMKSMKSLKEPMKAMKRKKPMKCIKATLTFEMRRKQAKRDYNRARRMKGQEAMKALKAVERLVKPNMMIRDLEQDRVWIDLIGVPWEIPGAQLAINELHCWFLCVETCVAYMRM